MQLEEYLRATLAVDEESPSGLVWKVRTARRVRIGQPALACLKPDGYYQSTIMGRKLYAHRVVFFLTHGYWPVNVDHLDGNRQNNKPSNLADVDAAENAENRMYFGCYLTKQGWRVRIQVKGTRKDIGTYPTKEDAISAYTKAKLEFHHSPRYKEVV